MKEIERLYREYGQDIYRYLVSLNSDPSLSEDLLSETFLRAIRSLARFKGESSLKTWLFSIARFTWYDYSRKNKEEKSFDEEIHSYIAKDLEKEYIKKEQASKILSILETRGEREKSIIIMRSQAYSYEEIGAKLGLNPSSARVINFRTKNYIIKKLKEEYYE